MRLPALSPAEKADLVAGLLNTLFGLHEAIFPREFPGTCGPERGVVAEPSQIGRPRLGGLLVRDTRAPAVGVLLIVLQVPAEELGRDL